MKFGISIALLLVLVGCVAVDVAPEQVGTPRTMVKRASMEVAQEVRLEEKKATTEEVQKGTSVRRTKAEWVKVIFDRELDGEYSLLDLSEKRGRPVKGRVYENTDTDLQVRQIVKEPDSQNLYRLFVLPIPGWGMLPMTILTEEEYVTDEALTTGFYLYNGTYTSETIDGETRTIREFIDLRNKSFPKNALPKE